MMENHGEGAWKEDLRGLLRWRTMETHDLLWWPLKETWLKLKWCFFKAVRGRLRQRWELHSCDASLLTPASSCSHTHESNLSCCTSFQVVSFFSTMVRKHQTSGWSVLVLAAVIPGKMEDVHIFILTWVCALTLVNRSLCLWFQTCNVQADTHLDHTPPHDPVQKTKLINLQHFITKAYNKM